MTAQPAQAFIPVLDDSKISPIGTRLGIAVGLSTRTPMLSALTRAEELGELSLEQFSQLSHRRVLKAQELYARWVVRRVLFWAERHLAPVNKAVPNWYVDGWRTVNYQRVGNPKPLTRQLVYSDSRLLYDLADTLRRYQVPERHRESVQTLIEMKLALKWGVR